MTSVKNDSLIGRKKEQEQGQAACAYLTAPLRARSEGLGQCSREEKGMSVCT